MIVLDASATAKLLLNLPLGAQVRRRLADPDLQLHAPHLLFVEVLEVLRRRVAAGMTSEADAAEALNLFEQLDVSFHDHMLLTGRAWALRGNLSAYHAMYVALAELLEAPLLTADAKLARAPGSHATIDLIQPWPHVSTRPAPPAPGPRARAE